MDRISDRCTIDGCTHKARWMLCSNESQEALRAGHDTTLLCIPHWSRLRAVNADLAYRYAPLALVLDRGGRANVTAGK
jgi:hypothetical protein